MPCLASISGLAVWSPAAAVMTVKLSGIDCSNARMAMGLLAMSISVPRVVPEYVSRKTVH